MSHSPAPLTQTRRELQQLTAARLRALAAERGLATSGRKSALVDRLYRLRQHSPTVSTSRSSSRDRSPTTRSSSARSRTPRDDSLPDLQRSVQRLVERSLRGMEERLLRSIQPPATGPATAATQDNISLPSPGPAPAPQPPARPPAPGTDSATARTPATSPTVQQPPLPDKVKRRILASEYIDFDTLLPESLYPARYGASTNPAFTLRLSSDPSHEPGDVVIAQPKPASKRTITDLASWMEAWNLYVQVLVASFPERAPSLLAYQAIICSASTRFPPRLWLRYDQRFRASVAADGTLRWDVRNNELWLECFTQSPLTSQTQPPSSSKSARRPCTYCGSFYHYPENCPSHPFRSPRSHASSPRASQPASQPSPATSSSDPSLPQLNTLPHPCRDFNKGICRRRVCRFSHICSKCREQSHSERDCPSSR